MLNKKVVTSIIIFNVIVLLLTGCASNRVTADRQPSFDHRSIKSLYVLKHNRDSHGINLLIAEKLKKMGYIVSTGFEIPSNVDANVTYRDRWMWDITLYMIELTVTVREKDSDFPLSNGNSFHTSLNRKSPEEMVEEVMTNLFSQSGNK
jgi:hypothetical protein